MSVVSDGEAIQASLDDPEAFERVFDRHFASVHRFVRRRVGLALADDIASETFVRAFERRVRYDLGWPNALPWLLRTESAPGAGISARKSWSSRSSFIATTPDGGSGPSSRRRR